ncbi:MAG: dienelactone hydrolase family protein [Gammaproteobacteria bacterium]|jgi:dienelactone hydrolase|tara:strand:- start:1337 stop:2038 length:702 start_codon:yes stop_codon:yes gene_type:complete
MKTEKITYQSGDKSFEGFLAQPEGDSNPCVLIAHTWAGRDAFVEEKAKLLTELGYAAFAIDMYGDGKIGTSNEENAGMMQPLLDDREELARRALASLDAVSKIDSIDASKIVIMGYCFGGLVAMDLARTGADIKGAVSFHGFLAGPENSTNEIKAKLLALHGDSDPMVGQDQIESFRQEMTSKKVDWQLHVFGGAMHSFTNPEANDPDFGAVYSKNADERSWKIFTDLLKELF